jgi:hypothetical protein
MYATDFLRNTLGPCLKVVEGGLASTNRSTVVEVGSTIHILYNIKIFTLVILSSPRMLFNA